MRGRPRSRCPAGCGSSRCDRPPISPACRSRRSARTGTAGQDSPIRRARRRSALRRRRVSLLRSGRIESRDIDRKRDLQNLRRISPIRREAFRSDRRNDHRQQRSDNDGPYPHRSSPSCTHPRPSRPGRRKLSSLGSQYRPRRSHWHRPIPTQPPSRKSGTGIAPARRLMMDEALAALRGAAPRLSRSMSVSFAFPAALALLALVTPVAVIADQFDAERHALIDDIASLARRTARGHGRPSFDPRVMKVWTPCHATSSSRRAGSRRLREPAAADRPRPDHLAALHRRADDRSGARRSPSTRCSRSAPARATRRR